LIPSSISFAQFDISIPIQPPQLLLDETGSPSTQLVAVDSILLLRGPFAVVNTANRLNSANDPNTRVTVFAMALPLSSGEPASSVVVNLTDINGQSYDIAAENVQLVPSFSFRQVTFRLPNNLPAGTCQLKLKAHNLTSNVGTIEIKN
jgi:hypothetical protein